MSAVLETLAELVAVDSVNPEWGGPGEAAMADRVEAFFADGPFEIETVEVLPGRRNVHVTLPGRDRSRRVVLEAHMDTVSVADMTIPPFEPERRDGRLYGRGACDTKGGFVGMMHALRDLADSGDKPPCDALFAAVIDEEHAFSGVIGLVDWLEKSGGALPEAAVVAEPTELRAVRANKGVARFNVRTKGVSAHSSKPHLGQNAIVAMARLIESLEAYHGELARRRSHPLVGAATGSIGLIEGGAQINFVPEHCTIAIDRRLLPEEKVADALDEYRTVIDRARADLPGIEVTLEEPDVSDEGMETPADSAVVRTASSALASLGLDPEPVGVPFGCDCTNLSRAGIPSIIFGPGSIDRAHGAVEYVEEDQVESAFAFYRKFLREFGA